MLIYLDTSAAAKLLVDEAESEALSTHLDHRAAAGGDIVAGALLETELRRLAARLGVDQGAVALLLDRVGMVVPDRRLYVEAGLLGGTRLRSLDALHLATALRLAVDELVAYDTRLLDAARALGVAVSTPTGT